VAGNRLPERDGDLLDHNPPARACGTQHGSAPGRTARLTWGSVNFSAKALTVTAPRRKSGHTRRVPLNGRGIGDPTAMHERQGKPAPTRFVFPATMVSE